MNLIYVQCPKCEWGTHVTSRDAIDALDVHDFAYHDGEGSR